MPYVKMLEFNRAGREIAQIRELVIAQLRDSPAGGDLCNVVEPLEAVDASHNFVMVTANDAQGVLARPVDDAAGIWVIANQVSAADDLVVLVFCVGEYGFESGPVGVWIADDEKAHEITVSRGC